MEDDARELVGTWTVKFMTWTWFYTFTADGGVTWRDPLNNENGKGRWSLAGSNVVLSWTGSSTRESWKRPVKPADQRGWCAASYGADEIRAKKVVSAGPTFLKDPDTGMVGSYFTAAGHIWRQDIETGSSATLALRNYKGVTVGLNNPTIAKLVTWYYEDLLYIDVVPTTPGNANLEARVNGAVVASMQIVVATNLKGAIYVDDFVGSYYALDYKRVNGNLSKWITLEYRDSVVIDVNIDDISDTHTGVVAPEGSLGAGARRFPTRLDPVTTPRLVAAKKRAIEVMMKDWVEFLEAAREGIFFILTINPLVAPIQTTRTGPVSRRDLPRRVSDHYGDRVTNKGPIKGQIANINRELDGVRKVAQDLLADELLVSRVKELLPLNVIRENLRKLVAAGGPKADLARRLLEDIERLSEELAVLQRQAPSNPTKGAGRLKPDE